MAVTRVTLLLFLSFAVTLHVNEACFTNIARIRLSQRMKTFTKTEAEVYHMEMDVRQDGNIVFSDGSSLKTSGGDNTVVIAGDALDSGYLDESNKHARFRDITGFHQIDHRRIIVADKQNHCLRQVDRQTGVTTTIAGKCGTAGYQDGAEARFYNPNGVYSVIGPYTNQSLKEKYLDKPEHKGILITDEGNMAVRLIRDRREVETLVRSPHLRGLTSLQIMLNMPAGDLAIMSNMAAGDLAFFVSTAEGVFLYGNDKLTSFLGKDKSSIPGVSFDPISPIRQFLFSAAGERPSQLLMIHLDGKNVVCIGDTKKRAHKEICSGKTGSLGKFGGLETCKLDRPQSLLVWKDSLFIGQNKAIRFIPADGSPEDVPDKPQSITSGVKRRVAFQSEYKIDCSLLGDQTSKDALNNIMEHNYQSLEKLDSGIPGLHRPTSSTKADIQCANGLMRVRWVTSIIYNDDITEVPAKLKADLTRRLVDRDLRLSAIVLNHFPPIVSPEVVSSGANAEIVLTTT